MKPAASALSRSERILNGPPIPTLFWLGLPTMVVVLAQIAVSIIEVFWISRLGTAALAGATLVFPILGLITTMSNGGIGGGVSSAVARELGAGRLENANAIAWHALILAILFGGAFTLLLIGFGTALYSAMGGVDDALAAAVLYSNWIFAGAIPLWILNLLSSAMRGAGDVRVPAAVAMAGAALLIPLSPLLIFGAGPIPALGVAGAGVAVLIYYCGGVLVLLRHLWLGKGTLTMRPVRLEGRHFRSILGVGLISAAGAIISNLTTVIATGAVGVLGAASIAGYGVASRIDFLLIPLLFGFGTAVITLIGVATGAGRPDRAREVGLKAALVALGVTQTIGLAAALFPRAWMGLFSDDPAVIAAGAAYLQIAAPFYGMLGVGLILYFASQGLGRMAWPFAGGMVRLVLSSVGAWWLVRSLDSITGPAIAMAAGSAVFGLINAYGFYRASRPRKG